MSIAIFPPDPEVEKRERLRAIAYGRTEADADMAGGGQYPELWRAGEGVIWPAHAQREVEPTYHRKGYPAHV